MNLYNGKRIIEVRIMSKMSKAIAMILIVAAVVFAAGCANKSSNTNNISVQTTPATVVTTAETNNTTEVAQTETPATEVTSAEANNNTENITENNTSSVTSITPEQIITQTTENTTSQTGTHISTAERNREIILSHMNNSAGTNTGTNTTNNTSQ